MWPLRTTDTSVNICKCIDVIGFTEDIFDTMLSPLTSLHKWCQVSIGLGIGLVSVRCQVTTLTNAELSPKADPGKGSDMIGLTPEAEIKWPTFSRATFSNAFSGMKMSILSRRDGRVVKVPDSGLWVTCNSATRGSNTSAATGHLRCRSEQAA